MKSMDEINTTLKEFEKAFGYKVQDVAQGTDAWLKLKLGVISASNASKVVAGKTTDTRLSYMSELVAQIATGAVEQLDNKYCDWGHSNEATARAKYSLITGFDITEVPFVFKDTTFREGCSPDGIVNEQKGVEIKCPYNTVHYIKFLTHGITKKEYDWQCQYTLRVMKADAWDFAQFDPRMKKKPLHVITVERDEDMQNKFNDMIPSFIKDMDKMLEQIGLKYGDQWRD